MMDIKACLFDLDGVIVDTAKFHYIAWKDLANELGFEFTEEHNELLKGVSRVRSLEILLSIGKVELSEEEIAKFLTFAIEQNKNADVSETRDYTDYIKEWAKNM